MCLGKNKNTYNINILITEKHEGKNVYSCLLIKHSQSLFFLKSLPVQPSSFLIQWKLETSSGSSSTTQEVRAWATRHPFSKIKIINNKQKELPASASQELLILSSTIPGWLSSGIATATPTLPGWVLNSRQASTLPLSNTANLTFLFII